MSSACLMTNTWRRCLDILGAERMSSKDKEGVVKRDINKETWSSIKYLKIIQGKFIIEKNSPKAGRLCCRNMLWRKRGICNVQKILKDLK